MSNREINNKGVTLVEVLVALVILTFVSLALMQTALMSIDANMANTIRDEAVSIAEQRMQDARSISFASLNSDPEPVTITRSFRNVANFTFTTQANVSTLDTNTKQVSVTVTWLRKGQTYTHTVTTIVRNPSA